ncbi:hypothetical protein [Schlesneria sp. DSM 10557]|uniref:hypothetical protein n=1 Tax=Schlesneria sp. DSM 10557 TaxID=3044399 RepID=UPI0035A0D8B2
MRFAVLCDHPFASPLIDALRKGVDGHRLSRIVTVGTSSAKGALFPEVNHSDSWEELLVSKEIDAVIVDGAGQHVLDGVKQLATANVPLVFIPRADQGSTLAYELSLIRDDNHVFLYPLLWHRFDNAVIALKTAIQTGRLGRIQFLQLHHTLSQAQEGMAIPQQEIDARLLHDVDLARWLMGDYNQITALRSGTTDAGVLMQNVVLSRGSLPEFNWQIQPTVGRDDWNLTVKGERGTARLSRSGSSGSWRCEIESEIVEGNEPETARQALAAISTALHEAGGEKTVSADDDCWGELVKTFETIDATHRSVKRRRTIELHFEPMSERAIFKTQMTALGCGLLVATLPLTLCYLGIASLIPLPSSVLIGLRMLIFAPLVLFLIVQILLPLTRPSTAERQSATSSSEL